MQFYLSLNGDVDTAGVRITRYFSYFTIESNLVVAVIAAMLAARPDRDGPAWRVLRLDSVMAIAVAGLVYVGVLRGLARATDTGLHYGTSILVVLGWLVFGPRPRFSWTALAYATIYPISRPTCTLIRGSIVHGYPYPFIDVDSHGYARVTVMPSSWPR